MIQQQQERSNEGLFSSTNVAVAGVIIAFAMFFIYINQNSVELMEAGETYSRSASIPHTNTTTPAPGYSPNMDSPPFNDSGYRKPGGQPTEGLCLQLDRTKQKERESYIPNMCRPGEEKVGFICYKKCSDKWHTHPDFPDTCRRCRDYSSSCDFLDMIVQKRTRTGTAVHCQPGHDKVGGLCFKPCPRGYKAESNMCIKCK